MRLPLAVLLFSLSAWANVALIPVTLPVGQVNQPYAFTIKPTGGCKPYIWSTSPTIAPGLIATPSVDTKSLLISGTPQIAGNWAFTITVKGCGGKSATASYALVVQGATQPHLVDLTWTAPTTPFVSYTVYRSLDGIAYAPIATGIAAELYSDTAVSSGVKYYYVVTDTDSTGAESAYSNAVSALVPSP